MLPTWLLVLESRESRVSQAGVRSAWTDGHCQHSGVCHHSLVGQWRGRGIPCGLQGPLTSLP